MTLLSLTAYAGTHGASRQAAAKWRDKGALVFVGDQVDVVKSDAKMKAAGLGRFRAAAATQPPATRPRNRGRNRAPVADAATPDDPDEDDEDEETGLPTDEELKDFVENLLQGRFLSKVGAAAIKENSLALKHLIAAKKAAGNVIEIEAAEKLFFDGARAERDAWLSFPTRIGPMLAADLGLETDPVVEALKVYVHEQLEQLGEPTVDFTADDG